MQLTTRHFGAIEIDENCFIDFTKGIPGFEDSTKFAILEGNDKSSPFKWLQSIDKPELTFAIVDPFAVKKDYDIELSNEATDHLEIKSLGDVEIYSIVVVPEDVSKTSMNLKAPVIINKRSKRGAQVILDTDRYGVRHYILEELQGREETENACLNKEEEPVDHNK